ncbi:MAG: hypothetical protein HWE24_07685 [Oceanospirillaceae bacterium]|nr:hypothetical protein [Oceanospirillaceae bacterium]
MASFAQSSGSEDTSENLFPRQEIILDSILKEANKLYSFESVAWHATDGLQSMSRKTIDKIGSYIIYEMKDSVYCVWVDQAEKSALIEMAYSHHSYSIPARVTEVNRSLNEYETDFIQTRSALFNQIATDTTYGNQIGVPRNFNFNPVFFKIENGWRLYLMVGTSEYSVVPYGNDYVIECDENGEITSFTMLHSRLLPFEYGNSEQTTITVMHNHRKSVPYITATDICIHRLYADYHQIDLLSVIAGDPLLLFEYRISTNKIVVKEI